MIDTDIIANWALDLDVAHARLRLYNEEPCTIMGPAWPTAAAQAEMSDNGFNYIATAILLDGRRSMPSSTPVP